MEKKINILNDFFAISSFAIIEKITSAAAAATTNLIEEKHIWQKSLRHSYPSGFSDWPNENSCNALMKLKSKFTFHSVSFAQIFEGSVCFFDM